MDEPAIEAQGLTRRFGSRVAVDHVSFAARRGDIIGLLGPNGAGKTTVIRMLSTLLTPSEGRFTVDGIAGRRARAIRRRIGVLPDGAGYPAQQSVLQYLVFFAQLYGSATAEATAHRLLAEVQLEARADSPVGALSHGMRQRLGIARALVNDPVVVFLDEPTLGLDPAGQQQILAILRRIAEQRAATVLLSTHTLSDVEAVCNRVLILDAGTVVSDGSVASVISSAVATRSARLRVAPQCGPLAARAIAPVDGVGVRFDGPDGDAMTILVTTQGAEQDRLNAVLAAVIGAGVPVVSFQATGARLTDAFLAVTGGGVR